MYTLGALVVQQREWKGQNFVIYMSRSVPFQIDNLLSDWTEKEPFYTF